MGSSLGELQNSFETQKMLHREIEVFQKGDPVELGMDPGSAKRHLKCLEQELERMKVMPFKLRELLGPFPRDLLSQPMPPIFDPLKPDAKYRLRCLRKVVEVRREAKLPERSCNKTLPNELIAKVFAHLVAARLPSMHLRNNNNFAVGNSRGETVEHYVDSVISSVLLSTANRQFLEQAILQTSQVRLDADYCKRSTGEVVLTAAPLIACLVYDIRCLDLHFETTLWSSRMVYPAQLLRAAKGGPPLKAAFPELHVLDISVVFDV